VRKAEVGMVRILHVPSSLTASLLLTGAMVSLVALLLADVMGFFSQAPRGIWDVRHHDPFLLPGRHEWDSTLSGGGRETEMLVGGLVASMRFPSSGLPSRTFSEDR
jgi:hypothetical protein